MIKTILYVVLSANCPATKLIGFEDGMTARDRQSFNAAKRNCVEHYSDAPCLKVFEKREELNYWAICGEESK